MKYENKNNTLTITGVDRFDLYKCCTCGQAFRWIECEKLPNEISAFLSVIRGRPVRAAQTESEITFFPCVCGDERIFIEYFDLERDYAEIERIILSDPRLKVCLPDAYGIRVFNQEPFEALISFIISANNNIKRISGIVDRLCRLSGKRLHFMGTDLYAFPTPDELSLIDEQQLKDIGAGYRAPYIVDTARRIKDGYDLETLRAMALDAARKELLAFKGVGPKVADCILLFSLGHTDAFPIDVWIDRAMNELFFDSVPPQKSEMREAVLSIGQYSGIIQQYIFYYARQVQLGKTVKKDEAPSSIA
ncbi:MAG: DNA glycosylase [Clostridia bacterium]|nr:DNA glycosylase [Clostridia bacterium]